MSDDRERDEESRRPDETAHPPHDEDAVDAMALWEAANRAIATIRRDAAALFHDWMPSGREPQDAAAQDDEPASGEP